MTLNISARSLILLAAIIAAPALGQDAWVTVLEEQFDRTELGPRWTTIKGQWGIEDGVLQFGGREAESFATIDEVRISTRPRYAFGTTGERAFVPPDAPFEMDDQALLICHLEQGQGALAAGGETVEITYLGF